MAVEGREVSELSPMERRVYVRLGETGDSNKVLAYALGISEYTVKVYIHAILVKLGVPTRSHAVVHYWKSRVDSVQT